MKTLHHPSRLRVLLATVVVLAVLGAAVPAATIDPVDLLIVDLTQTVEDSMKVEALARILMTNSVVPFRISALFSVPEGVWEAEPVDLVLVLPETGSYMWLCAPALTAELPRSSQQAVQVVGGAADRVFAGDRWTRGLEDDLISFSWSATLYRQGVFGEGIDR